MLRQVVIWFWSLTLILSALGGSAATITIQTNLLGITPSLLAYNSGHFVPGSNTRDWWHYSGVSGARVFISPGVIEPGDDIAGRGDGVTDQATFLSRKAALRSNPLNTNYINWPYFTNNFNTTDQHGSNLLNPNGTCSDLRQLGIEIQVCLTASEGSFTITDANDWAGRWELWQNYYAEAFYLARYFDVQRFQMYNEPNAVSSLTAIEFLERLQITSDAIQSAVADVNQLYGKSLAALVYAPVSAGTASSTYASWGKLVVTNRHTDFLGQTDPNFWLVRKYDYHEYNSSPVNFGANLASLHNNLTIDMSPEIRFPTAISEFNVHTASTFDTTVDTLDTPWKYARFGSIVVNLAKNSCDELYVFKFSQTLNSTTVKKNGMHFVDNTNSPYNIGGITKAGEVYRLFSQAAPAGRQRLSAALGSGAGNLDVLTTFNPASRLYQLFSANPSNNVDLTLDVSACNLPPGQKVMLQEVSENIWGGVRSLLTVSNNQVVAGIQPTNSVWLFTMPAKAQEPVQTLLATDDTMVQDGANRGLNYGSSNSCLVRNNSTNASLRSAAFFKFHLPLVYHPDFQIALLAVRASSLNGSTNVQAHVYGLTSTNWSQNTLTWSNAPNLGQNVPAGSDYTNNFILGAGSSAQMVGQIVADNTSADRFIDVTRFLREAPGSDVAFLLAREVRFFGDSQDDDGMAITSKEASSTNGPRLIFVRLRDTDGDGLGDETETNVFGTDPLVVDTDHDGLTDGEEVILYGTSPLTNSAVPPTINVPPASQTVQVGTTVGFTVSAFGSPPLAYQWYFNASNALAGATTATLTLPNVQLSQSGNYTVAITNPAGAVTSSIAQLQVQSIPPPPLPIYEPMNYNAGDPLAGQGGWLLNAGTGATIESGNLSYNGLADSLGNRLTWGTASMSLRLPLGTNLTSGQIYFSFLMRADTIGSFTGVGTLAGFTTGTGQSFATKVNIQPDGGSGYVLGTSKAGGTTFGAWAPQSFSAGQIVFVVGRYTFLAGTGTDDLCDLWLNPGSETFGAAMPPTATLPNLGAGGADLPQIDRFFFRAGGGTSAPNKLVTDELRLGLTWADVTTPAKPSLTIIQSGSNVLVSWPTNALGFTLQSATNVLAPVNWSAISGSPAVSGTNYTSTLPATNTARFFRLSR